MTSGNRYSTNFRTTTIQKNLPLNSSRGRKWGYRCKVALPCEKIFWKVNLKKKEQSQIWMCSLIPGLCAAPPVWAVLQLGALALSFSCAGEIILPLRGPALPTHSVIRLHHLHHSRMGSRVGGNGRGRTKRRVSPEPVYMLLRCLSACAHTTRPLTGAACRMRNQHQLSRYDCAADLFPRIKVKLK